MTVPTTVGVSRHDGNGATSAFDVGFHFQAKADLEVIVVNTTTDTDTTLALNTNYTVTGEGDQSGGTVTLTGDYANLSSVYKIYIGLAPALNNSTSFVGSGKVSNAQLQIAFDRMSQRHIYLKALIDRCIKIPKKETPTEANTVLPDSTDRAERTFTWSAAGAPTAGTASDASALSVTAIGETIVEAANAGAVLDALGLTTLTKQLIDDTTTGQLQTTIGISAPAQTILDDASVAAIRATLGLDGASGVIEALDLANAITPQLFQARLTLTSGTPVTTGTVNSSTIYLTPYKGDKIATYNGTRWKIHTLTEISLALTATQDKNYDVWVYDNAGTLTLETTEWTNDSTRATALATQNGVYCKTGALTRRYVGTFRAHAADTTTDGAAKRFVWNYYNRAPRALECATASVSWTYTTATWRQMEASASNQVAYVIGVTAEEEAYIWLSGRSSNSSGGTDRRMSVGFNSTTAPGFATANAFEEATTAVYAHTLFCVSEALTAGYSYAAMLEYSEAAGTTTWYGPDTVSGISTTRLRMMMKM